MLHLAWIVPLALLIAFIASPRFRGDIAETRVRRLLAQGLERKRYTILNDVVIPAGGGTIDIDHVVVSKCGIFVIESVYASGSISGTEVQDRWTARGFFRTIRFENPVHRNRLQAEALATLLDYPPRAFHRFVVMTGHERFKHERPPFVVEPEDLVRNMRKKAEHILTAEQAAHALSVIEAQRLGPSRGFFVSYAALVCVILLLLLVVGLYLAFGESLRGLL